MRGFSRRFKTFQGVSEGFQKLLGPLGISKCVKTVKDSRFKVVSWCFPMVLKSFWGAFKCVPRSLGGFLNCFKTFQRVSERFFQKGCQGNIKRFQDVSRRGAQGFFNDVSHEFQGVSDGLKEICGVKEFQGVSTGLGEILQP